MAVKDHRARLKGRRQMSGTFAMVPSTVLDSPAYAALSWPARALLMELASYYRGSDGKRREGNNGDLCAAYTNHQQRGWARSTLQSATKELELAGFILRTRQGGRNACNLYAVTWQPVDHCKGKIDADIRVGGPPLKLWEKTV